MLSQVICLLTLAALSSVHAVTQTVTVGANGAKVSLDLWYERWDGPSFADV